MEAPDKVQQLVAALLEADQQVRERVKFHSQLEGDPEKILRRDAYTEIVGLWLKSLGRE